jgi:hypothetical protein
MLTIGCDFHPGFQQVAIYDNRTGEIQEKRLQHRDEAERFSWAVGSGAGGDGGVRALSLVRTAAGGAGLGVVVRGCGAGAGLGGAAAF